MFYFRKEEYTNYLISVEKRYLKLLELKVYGPSLLYAACLKA